MSTETFSYTVTYSNGIFRVYQATNGDLLALAPLAQAVIKTHPSAANLYYFGTNGNIITLDYTLCTNLTNTTRIVLIDNIVSLAGTAPIGAVTISGQPIQTVPTISLGENYGFTSTRATSGNAIILRPGAALTQIKLNQLMGSTSTALSSGTSIVLLFGATVTGGTWATSATVVGSQVEFNSGGTVTGGTQMYVMPFNQSAVASLNQIPLTALQTLVVVINQTGIGNTTAAINWTETP